MQTNILDRYPDADVRVYAVWVSPSGTDDRAAVDQLLGDDRVQSFWDAEGAIARWVGDNQLAGFSQGDFAYDLYLLLAPDAVWKQAPPPVLSTGAPVVFDGSRLATALAPYATQ